MAEFQLVPHLAFDCTSNNFFNHLVAINTTAPPPETTTINFSASLFRRIQPCLLLVPYTSKACCSLLFKKIKAIASWNLLCIVQPSWSWSCLQPVNLGVQQHPAKAKRWRWTAVRWSVARIMQMLPSCKRQERFCILRKRAISCGSSRLAPPQSTTWTI